MKPTLFIKHFLFYLLLHCLFIHAIAVAIAMQLHDTTESFMARLEPYIKFLKVIQWQDMVIN